MKLLAFLALLTTSLWSSSGQDLTQTWVGVVSLILFIGGYYVIASE